MAYFQRFGPSVAEVESARRFATRPYDLTPADRNAVATRRAMPWPVAMLYVHGQLDRLLPADRMLLAWRYGFDGWVPTPAATIAALHGWPLGRAVGRLRAAEKRARRLVADAYRHHGATPLPLRTRSHA